MACVVDRTHLRSLLQLYVDKRGERDLVETKMGAERSSNDRVAQR